ncbi:MAG: hypothetical protein GWP63_22385 [Haliea sp.]|jgi:hypothetical protein|nr:hypothetical protein [Haliea sp.]
MKSTKLLTLATSICLLLGWPNLLIAQTDDCSDGFIVDRIVDEILIETDDYCFISNVTVLGNLTVRNAINVVVRKSEVSGSILISDSDWVMVFNNIVVDGNISVLRPIVSYIVENTVVRTGDERYIAMKGTRSDGEGLVLRNLVGEGTINCATDSGEVDDRVYAQANIATNIRCLGQGE